MAEDKNTQFVKNAYRIDPYKNFKFCVIWGGKTVAGVSKVSGLKRTTDVIKHREGGDESITRKSPGRTDFEAITLERGVTHDAEFEAWAHKVWGHRQGPNGKEVSLKDFRKDIQIVLFNEAGQVAKTYHVFRCWVSEYHPLPDLDANGNGVAIQSIKIENEGWQIDPIEEPTEPSYELPNNVHG